MSSHTDEAYCRHTHCEYRFSIWFPVQLLVAEHVGGRR